MSNSFDPDQARHFVGPGLGPNYLQRLSADNTSRQRVNPLADFQTSRQKILQMRPLGAVYFSFFSPVRKDYPVVSKIIEI